MRYEKVYVDVVARFSKNGGIRPITLVFRDERYEIKRVLSAERAPARVRTVLPIRFTCEILGRDRAIFFEPQELRWFVEKSAD